MCSAAQPGRRGAGVRLAGTRAQPADRGHDARRGLLHGGRRPATTARATSAVPTMHSPRGSRSPSDVRRLAIARQAVPQHRLLASARRRPTSSGRCRRCSRASRSPSDREHDARSPRHGQLAAVVYASRANTPPRPSDAGIAIDQDGRNRLREGRVLFQLGRIKALDGKHTEAIDVLSQAIEVLRDASPKIQREAVRSSGSSNALRQSHSATPFRGRIRPERLVPAPTAISGLPDRLAATDRNRDRGDGEAAAARTMGPSQTSANVSRWW